MIPACVEPSAVIIDSDEHYLQDMACLTMEVYGEDAKLFDQVTADHPMVFEWHDEHEVVPDDGWKVVHEEEQVKMSPAASSSENEYDAIWQSPSGDHNILFFNKLNFYCYPRRQKPGNSLNRLDIKPISTTQPKLGPNKVQIAISEQVFMLSNKVRTGETQSHQIIIDSGASSITLNSTWKDAIQNITPTSESV